MQIFKLQQFISLYQNTVSFKDFFNELKLFLVFNQRDITNFIDKNEIKDYITFLNDYITNYPKIIKNSLKKKLIGEFFTSKILCNLVNERAFECSNINNSKKLPKILDPSCGNGFFIIENLFLYLTKFNNYELKEFSNKIINGIDIDLKNIDISRKLIEIIFACLLTFYEIKNKEQYFNEIRSIIKKNVINGDFLKMDNIKNFDIIVGNPPYIRVHKINKNYNKFLRKKFNVPYKDFDIYICFFEYAIKLITKNGIVAFITPEKYLLRNYAKKLRLFFLENTIIKELIDISRCKDAFNVNTYPIITILKKINSEAIFKPGIDINSLQNYNKLSEKTLYIRIEERFGNKINNLKNLIKNKDFNNLEYSYYNYHDYKKFFTNPNYEFFFNADKVFRYLEQQFFNLKRIDDFLEDFEIFCGTPRAKDYKLLGNSLIENRKGTNNLKYIVSRNIFPFSILWGIDINSTSEKYTRPYLIPTISPYNNNIINKFYEIPKILLKANSRRLTAAIDKEGYSFNGVYGINIKEKNHIFKKFNFHFLVAIMNSNLINYYLIKKFQSYMLSSKYISINSNIIKSIPLPNVDNKNKSVEIIIKKSKNIQERIKLISEKYVLSPSINKDKKIIFIKSLKNIYSFPKSNLLNNTKEPLILEFKEKLKNIYRDIEVINKEIYFLYDIDEELFKIIENYCIKI